MDINKQILYYYITISADQNYDFFMSNLGLTNREQREIGLIDIKTDSDSAEKLCATYYSLLEVWRYMVVKRGQLVKKEEEMWLWNRMIKVK